MSKVIRVGDKGTYVERIAWKNASNPFIPLSKYGVKDVQRLPEHDGFKLDDLVVWEKSENRYIYCSIEYIVRVISRCELEDEIVFFLNRPHYRNYYREMVITTKALTYPKDFELEDNSILLSGPDGSYGVFDGYEGYSVDHYTILKQAVSAENQDGLFKYEVHIPFWASGIDVTNIPREKHVSGMKSLNDEEITLLRERGVTVIIAKNLTDPRW